MEVLDGASKNISETCSKAIAPRASWSMVNPYSCRCDSRFALCKDSGTWEKEKCVERMCVLVEWPRKHVLRSWNSYVDRNVNLVQIIHHRNSTEARHYNTDHNLERREVKRIC
jgi:hypothetical protein